MLRENLFKKYKNDIFVESGSYAGDGIQFALEAEFDKIYSIELSEFYYKLCLKRFENVKQVNLLFGDSSIILYDIIKKINEPITFWLDGHYSGGNTAIGKYTSPLMQELDQIKNHNINNHIIIIDDMRCWKDNDPDYGFSETDIINKLKEINLNYKFIYENGLIPNDVLIAKP